MRGQRAQLARGGGQGTATGGHCQVGGNAGDLDVCGLQGGARGGEVGGKARQQIDAVEAIFFGAGGQGLDVRRWIGERGKSEFHAVGIGGAEPRASARWGQGNSGCGIG
jgi:hypothetical protein